MPSRPLVVLIAFYGLLAWSFAWWGIDETREPRRTLLALGAAIVSPVVLAAGVVVGILYLILLFVKITIDLIAIFTAEDASSGR